MYLLGNHLLVHDRFVMNLWWLGFHMGVFLCGNLQQEIRRLTLVKKVTDEKVNGEEWEHHTKMQL